jgi:bifunctional polynucleotide phosphatase/kinase
MIHKILSPRFRSKILFIDYDWTIVKPKLNTAGNQSIFPKDISDWIWLRPSVPSIIKNYYDKGYAIYIVTNQSKKWKIDQIIEVMTLLKIPLTILIALEKEDYKPSLRIVKEAIKEKQFEKINKEKSLMCGDALGRKNDHSDSDKIFAEKMGIKVLPPEDIFPEDIKKLDIVLEIDFQEIIIMVGAPGSGKTTYAIKNFPNYSIIHGDIYKTSKKMLQIAKKEIDNKKSIIIDALNSTMEKRKEYIDLAKELNIKIRCIYMNTILSEAMIRNSKRDKPVPKIVYNVYNKKFELPIIDEGFYEVNII